MLKILYFRQFDKDIKKFKKRGKDLNKIKKIIQLLSEEKQLPTRNQNHKLRGDFKNHWECHIEPNWLLIYKKTKSEIIFIKTGSHSDLF